MEKRSSGILLHITSLPGNEGVGTLGREAYHFVNFLSENGQKVWQILPLGPTGYGNSPYQCYSAFAGNIFLIDLELLVEEGLLESKDLLGRPAFSKHKAEFEKEAGWKIPLLKKSFEKFERAEFCTIKNDYSNFLKEHSWWLNDFALFMALKDYFGGKPWHEWEEEGLKFRETATLNLYFDKLKEEVAFGQFLQFLFFRQWSRLKNYANSKGIRIIGDVPLYVATDSADVWANTDIFLLDENLKPRFVGGVPPDYFSETGQLWGNPVYNWPRLRERNFDWWLARLYFNLNLFDLARIDHFRGLESFWSVSATEKTAIVGEWVPALGYELLSLFRNQHGNLPFLAEDLGVITPEVEKLRDDFNLPGMKILQFAYTSDETNVNLPHNFNLNCVAYTGTHDNDTTRGWFSAAGEDEKNRAKSYLGTNQSEIARVMMETAWASVAPMAIAPMQDLLNLGTKARMNTPGTATGNWGWRFCRKQLKKKQAMFLKEITIKYSR